MPPQHDPKNHIHRLPSPPRGEGVVDQREITVQSYRTTMPFGFDSLDRSLNEAWLNPQIRLGVLARIPSTDQKALTVVLGLQDELTVRAYDYDSRRSLWYSWQDAIVETVKLQYYRDEDGLLCFTTMGGGHRISDDVLYSFNSEFLDIRRDFVTKRYFDLFKLRDLCFRRFRDRLYMIRFAEPSKNQYRTIDVGQFQSRKYIDPNAERLKEISSDQQARIESFDSDIEVQTEDLMSSIQVRFYIRGLSGSLRLRFPKVPYKSRPETDREQAQVFYRIVNIAVNAILDGDYYTHQTRTLDELSADLGLFSDSVDLTPFRETLARKKLRETFFHNLDLEERWSKWEPHLRVIDELLASNEIIAHVKSLLDELVRRAPRIAVHLLVVCQDDPPKCRVGGLVALALASHLQSVPQELRAQVEEEILSWAVAREEESWDIDADSSEICVFNLRRRIDDFAFDFFPIILWKLLGVLHARLRACTGDVGALLQKYAWCITAARNVPAHHSKSRPALRLVSADRVPSSTRDATQVLKVPVGDLRALDDAVLSQFGLPLWPLLTATRHNGKVALRNDGIGAALTVIARVGEQPTANNKPPTARDIPSGGTVTLELPDNLSSVNVQFEKFGRTYQLRLPVVADAASATAGAKNLPVIINRKRLKEQRTYRERIDPERIVVGASPALLQLFEHIHHANTTDGPPPVLLLGEPGVGKTHIAKLLHQSSNRASQKFKAVNAGGGGGGDINIQRGEWIGYGKGHGIHGIDKKGRAGHLMHADGGTLFIDEFAALSLDLQVIFLSVLEKRSIEKIGGESLTPDVRCIFATNADIAREVAKGSLRSDLLDRIPIRILIPPLRERLGDVLLLAKRFAAEHSITDRCLIALLRYQWPGNVRELQNKMLAAKAKQKTEGKNAIDLGHLDLPADTASVVEAMDENCCRRELWTVADEIARNEGFEQGAGLQRRAGEILGVSEAQASKMYRELGLTNTTAASD